MCLVVDNLFIAELQDWPDCFSWWAKVSYNRRSLKCGTMPFINFDIFSGALCTLVFAERISSISKKVAEIKAKALSEAKEQKEIISASKEKAKGKKSSKQPENEKKASAQQIDDDAEQGADAMEEEMGLAASADADHEMVIHLKIIFSLLKLIL